jgi:hypothetical protein
MAEREWYGRVKPIFDASQGPIARSGGAKSSRSPPPHWPAARVGEQGFLRPIPDWLGLLQRRGLAARDSRTTAIPPPFQPTEEEAAGDGLTLGNKLSHTLPRSHAEH